MKSIDDLARACGVEADFIRSYAESQRQSAFYNKIAIPKKGKRRKGDYRVVFEAVPSRLAQLHRGISMTVVNSAAFGEHVQGFVKKRSTRTNALQHIGAKVLLHADIKGFFDAITEDHVRDALVTHGTELKMAMLLAKACTIEGLLRQGTRCSPAIANLVCYDLDQAFLRLAGANECVYTRYADDLTFSGDSVPSDESVRDILRSRGFVLRDDKCFRQHRGKSQYVTGLTVADKQAPRLPRRLKRQLRLTFHHIKKHGLTGHFERLGVESIGREIAWLDGILKYARSIEPRLVQSWQETLADALVERVSNERRPTTEGD